MPRYDYEPSDGKPCGFCGGRFQVTQPITEDALKECPMCDRPVRRVITSAPHVQARRSNAELRDLGLTKLEKRADGTYENVTRRHGEPRIIDPSKPGGGLKPPPGADD